MRKVIKKPTKNRYKINIHHGIIAKGSCFERFIDMGLGLGKYCCSNCKVAYKRSNKEV